MLKTLVDIQLALQNRINTLRCVQRIVVSEEFQSLFQSSDIDEQNFVVSLIEKGDRISLEQWSKTQAIKQSELDDLPIRVLRTLAQELGVSNYSQLSKPYLVAQIKTRNGHARTVVTNRTIA